MCKDVRSDIESSSEEEAGASTDSLKASHASRGENGTNGHCAAAKTRALNHSGWWPRRLQTPAASVRSHMLVNWQWTLQHLLRGAPEQHVRCKAVKNPTMRAIWVVIIFDRGDLVVARCCSVSMFSPLVRWTRHSWTVEMLHTSPYDSWYCDFDQLFRGDLLGVWPQDQKFEWWYYFLCSLWISFNSIVYFTVFIFLLRPNVYEIATTSTGN